MITAPSAACLGPPGTSEHSTNECVARSHSSTQRAEGSARPVPASIAAFESSSELHGGRASFDARPGVTRVEKKAERPGMRHVTPPRARRFCGRISAALFVGIMEDLDAVTMPEMPRANFTVGGGHVCAWAQSTDTVTIYLSLTPPTAARALDVTICRTSVRIAHRSGGQPLLAGELGHAVRPDESEWEVIGGELVITLAKALRREWIAPLMPSAMDELAVQAAPSVSTAAAVAAAAPAPVCTQHADCGGVAPPSKSALAANYRAWDQFDEAGALMALENEDAKEPSWSVRAGGGSASVQCAEYKKDKEEVQLDLELSEKREALQAMLVASVIRLNQ